MKLPALVPVAALVSMAGCGASAPIPLSPPLAALASARGLHVGTFFFSAAGPPGGMNTAFVNTLGQFDLWTVPVFFNFVEPQPHEFDFTLADAVVDAAPSGTELYASGLIYNSDRPDLIPSWLLSGGFTGAQKHDILVEYVDTVVRHFEHKYPGRVRDYEVVLEPLSWPGPPGPTGFWQGIGLEAGLDKDEYARLAFATARAAAPAATLYIDDFGVEGAGNKADRYYALVTALRAAGAAIGGVGMEGHFAIGEGGPFPAAPPADEIAANLSRLAALGTETMITSVDVSLPDGASSALGTQQADAYTQVLSGCLQASGCRAFSTWGVGDADSWIPMSYPGWGSPLLFDNRYAPKPAYAAVRHALATQ
jgi:endo-1,4-beta-xylanase